eukprot:jgi/Botrbrau1/22830/Bobra.0132s0153.1
MADSTSAQNQWVESYLEALLGQGLSSEYTRSEKTETATNVDADRNVTARYYLNSVLQMGEEGIRDAWSKATSSRHTKEKDLRLEHLSWRVWFMKRKKAAALLEKQKASGLPDDTKDHLLDDTSDDDVPTPRAVKAELAKSISKELSLKPEIGKGMLPATVAADLPRLTKKLSVTTVVPKEKESSKQWLEQEYEAEHTPQQETPPRDVFENRVKWALHHPHLPAWPGAGRAHGAGEGPGHRRPACNSRIRFADTWGLGGVRQICHLRRTRATIAVNVDVPRAADGFQLDVEGYGYATCFFRPAIIPIVVFVNQKDQ